ncbi:MAG: hypothetical protein M1281_03690 [Chloroflexi bacterium]|nr:hypothetical protein [Chloroflexota bacterium]
MSLTLCVEVIFKPNGNYREYPPLEELIQGLVILNQTQDGTIYTGDQR